MSEPGSATGWRIKRRSEAWGMGLRLHVYGKLSMDMEGQPGGVWASLVWYPAKLHEAAWQTMGHMRFGPCLAIWQ